MIVKKRLLALLIAGCMVFSMTACGNEKKEEEKDTTGSETTETVDTSALGKSTLEKLGEYKGLTYTPMDTTVTDEEVESQVQNFVSSNPTKVSRDVVGETSIVNIDYVGKKDDVAFDGGTAQGQELDIANSGYIPGFAESIVGMKVGETKDCPMTFPEDYHSEDLAGADVVFTITVNECWENVDSELNDEFAAANGYENVDEIYAVMRENLVSSKNQEAEADRQYQLIQKVIDNSTFAMDEDEIALYVSDLQAQYETYASYFGMDLESYVTTASGMTMEEFEAQCREIALYRIQSPLVLSAIAEAEGLEVSDEEYEQRASVYQENYGYETLEELEEAYTKETVLLQVTADMARDFLVENAVAEEK